MITKQIDVSVIVDNHNARRIKSIVKRINMLLELKSKTETRRDLTDDVKIIAKCEADIEDYNKNIEESIAECKQLGFDPTAQSAGVTLNVTVSFADNQTEYIAALKKMTAEEVVESLKAQNFPNEIADSIEDESIVLKRAIRDGASPKELKKIKKGIIKIFAAYLKSQNKEASTKEAKLFDAASQKIAAIKGWNDVITACDFLTMIANNLKKTGLDTLVKIIKFRPIGNSRDTTMLQDVMKVDGFITETDVTKAKEDLQKLLGNLSQDFEKNDLTRQ